MNWGNVLLDGMFVLAVAVVLGTGVTLSYILVRRVMEVLTKR